MHVEKRGGAAAQLLRSYITGTAERARWTRGKNLQAKTSHSLPRTRPREVSFRREYHDGMPEPEIKSEVRLAAAVAGSSGSLFSDDMALDKPRHKA